MSKLIEHGIAIVTSMGDRCFYIRHSDHEVMLNEVKAQLGAEIQELKARIKELESASEPEHEWVYGVICYGDSYWPTRNGLQNGRCLNEGWFDTPEKALRYLMDHPEVKYEDTFYGIPTPTPIFGVRKLTEKERQRIDASWTWGAFYKGKYIRGSGSSTHLENCIKNVLGKLKPATPAVTLDDLQIL